MRKLRSPRALAWARANAALDGVIEWTALPLFADLAEPPDAPRLLELLTEAVTHGNTHLYDQYSLVSALGRLDHVASAATVEAIFDSTVYSYLRTQCAETLSRVTTDFATDRAAECLDDCESETRRIGIAHANVSIPEIRERVSRRADDPTEDDNNRQAAATRIMHRS